MISFIQSPTLSSYANGKFPRKFPHQSLNSPRAFKNSRENRPEEENSLHVLLPPMIYYENNFATIFSRKIF